MAEESGFDPTMNTLVEAGQTHTEALPQPPQGGHIMPGTAKVELINDSADSVLVHVNTDTSGMLILADQFYPGWQASVDNRNAPMYVANAFTRAVYVGKGIHDVRFEYRPLSLIVGTVLFAAGVVWLSLLKRLI